MSTEPFDAELIELARRLGAMPLAPPGLSRDRVMFLAGRATGTRRRRAREAAAALVLTVAVLPLGIFLGARLPREPVVLVRVVPAKGLRPPSAAGAPVPAPVPHTEAAPVAASPPVADTEPLEDSPLWRQRLRQVEEPPQSAGPLVGAAPALPPLEEFLDLPPGALDPIERRRWQAVLHAGETQ